MTEKSPLIEQHHTILRIISHAKRISAEQVALEPVGPAVNIIYSSKDKTLETYQLPIEGYEPLKAVLRARCFYWPDDPHFIDESRKTRMLTSIGPNRSFFAEVSMEGENTLIKDLRFEGIEPVASYLDLSKANSALLKKGITQKTGLCICNAAEREHHIDGSAIISALRPDALMCLRIGSLSKAQEAIELAKESFVICSIVGNNDAIDLGLHFIEEFKLEAPTLIELLYSHLRVRRSCPFCQKPATISARTLERLPESLRPPSNRAHQFGRGCKECGESAYRGTVGIDSIVAMFPELESLLKTDHHREQLGRLCYAQGSKALLEDGVEKIYLGSTSFEEVLRVKSSLPPGFESREIAKVQEAEPLEGLEESFFMVQENIVEDKQILLIVEDDENQRAILSLVLEKAGYEVHTAGNGKEGLEKLEQENSVDLIVCDLMMPQMGGEEMVKKVRANLRWKTIPVLMLTAVSNPETEYEMLEHGADEYCEKNVRKKILLKRIENLLKRKSTNPLRHLLED